MPPSHGSPSFEIRGLQKSDKRATFDCGHEGLTKFLRERARQDQSGGQSQTLVAVDDSGEILGYVTIVGTRMERKDQKTIPALLLGRMGVSLRAQRAGVGRALVRVVVERAFAMRDLVGCDAVVVEAKLATNAPAFYERLGFQRLDPRDEGTDFVRMVLSLNAILKARQQK